MKILRKSIILDGIQWWPPGDVRHDPSMLSHRKGNSVEPPDYRQMGDIFQFSTVPGFGDDVFFIRTIEGDMKLSPGAWIITGTKGERWSVREDIFEETYEVLS